MVGPTLKLQGNNPTIRRSFVVCHGSRVRVRRTELPVFSPWRRRGRGGPGAGIHHAHRRGTSRERSEHSCGGSASKRTGGKDRGLEDRSLCH
uniref:Uncharacterized protein n=1 Tax=Picea sitchensis TaxID=3332 RepID=A9NWB6_PICSI|nr:unknown [Picea sitchensis]